MYMTTLTPDPPTHIPQPHPFIILSNYLWLQCGFAVLSDSGDVGAAGTAADGEGAAESSGWHSILTSKYRQAKGDLQVRLALGITVCSWVLWNECPSFLPSLFLSPSA